MKKYAIYVRQSLDKKDSLSIESQIDLCINYLGNPSEDEYIIYRDSGWSGKNLERPSMKKLINDIKNELISKVVCYRLDRLARSVLHFNNLLVIFKDHNVEFASATEAIETSTSIGRAMVNIISVFSELERENIIERITTNYHKRVQEGIFPGGNTILGFKSERKLINGKNLPVLVSNSDSKIVKDMFDYYISGNVSLRNTAIYINKKYNKSYDSSMISKYLRNPIYVKSNPDIYNFYKSKGYIIYNNIEEYTGNGLYIIGKRNSDRKYNPVNKQTVLVALHEGIIDSDTFLQVQYKLSKNKQIKRTGKSKYTWITNIYCNKCKNRMALQTNKNNITYLNCRTKMRNNGCTGLDTIRVADIDPYFEDLIQNKLNILSTEKIQKEDQYLKDIDDYKIRLSKIDDEIEIYKSKILMANDIVMNIINEKIEELVNEKNTIINQMNNIKVVEEVSLEKLILDKPFKSLDFNKKKEIFQLLINKVYIDNNELNVIWNI